MSPAEAAARQEKTDVDALDWAEAAAYAATVEVSVPDQDQVDQEDGEDFPRYGATLRTTPAA